MTKDKPCGRMPMMNLNERIRKAILAGPKNRATLARETGLSEAFLSLFVRGKRAGLRTEAAEALAKALDLEIIVRPRQRAKRKKGR